MNRVGQRRLTVVLILAVVAVVFGCGGVRQAAQKAKRDNQLKAVALAYHNCNDATGKGPANAAQLGKYLADFPEALQAVQNGDIVVYWGAKVPTDFPAGASNTVLAYEKAVPSNGGLVAMGDASTRSMTAAEFAAAPKPKQAGQ